VNPDSFINVAKYWIPELREHIPYAPVVLCGSMVDLRDDLVTIQKLKDKNQQPVTRLEGEFLALMCGCIGYVENSALSQQGEKETMDGIFSSAYAWPDEQSTKLTQSKKKNCKLQ
jgi:Ras-related C3 botulinum toxin substrate 1